jgi:lipoyl(octanoyl) transferase
VNDLINRDTRFIDLGMVDYQEALDYQTKLFHEILAVKTVNRNSPQQTATPNYLLFCEHPHVYTLGKSGDEKNLLVPKEDLGSIDASYYHINRGGDITYHGPGQLVVYPVMDLDNFFTDIHKYMRLLEEAIIQTIEHYGVVGERIAGLTGVWMGATDNLRKICAFGVKTSRWVTMHGLALNVNTDLGYFNHIVPCGIDNKKVTSLKQELGREIHFEEVKTVLCEKLAQLFGMKMITNEKRYQDTRG